MSDRFKHNHWKLTRSGKVFNYEKPSPESIDIEDIATALSRICRFGAHTVTFYSVAQHSLLMLHHARDKDAMTRMAVLMHDATEAYIGDIPGPLEALIPYVWTIEARIMDVIASKYGFSRANDDDEVRRLVTELDERALVTEFKLLMPPCEIKLFPDKDVAPFEMDSRSVEIVSTTDEARACWEFRYAFNRLRQELASMGGTDERR